MVMVVDVVVILNASNAEGSLLVNRPHAVKTQPITRSVSESKLRAVMSERENWRAACVSLPVQTEVPEGSRRSARRTHFWPREV